MPRLSRTAPLPDVPRSEVPDATTQRAITSITTALQAVLKFLKPYAQPEPWRVLPYFSDWARALATLQEPQFRKEPGNYVELRGWTYTPTGGSSTIAVLPLGYRPPLRTSFTCACVSGGSNVFSRVDVVEDGRILLISPAVGANTNVSLSNIRFDVEA